MANWRMNVTAAMSREEKVTIEGLPACVHTILCIKRGIKCFWGGGEVSVIRLWEEQRGMGIMAAVVYSMRMWSRTNFREILMICRWMCSRSQYDERVGAMHECEWTPRYGFDYSRNANIRPRYNTSPLRKHSKRGVNSVSIKIPELWIPSNTVVLAWFRCVMYVWCVNVIKIFLWGEYIWLAAWWMMSGCGLQFLKIQDFYISFTNRLFNYLNIRS